jgi:hypothetical protein
MPRLPPPLPADNPAASPERPIRYCRIADVVYPYTYTLPCIDNGDSGHKCSFVIHIGDAPS